MKNQFGLGTCFVESTRKGQKTKRQKDRRSKYKWSRGQKDEEKTRRDKRSKIFYQRRQIKFGIQIEIRFWNPIAAHERHYLVLSKIVNMLQTID